MSDTKKAIPFTRDLLHPKHWLTWLGLGCIRLLVLLPYPWLLTLGKYVGLAAHRLVRSRRHVAEVNISLCFPELSSTEQARLVRQTFIDTSIGLIETMLAWFRRPDYLLPLAHFKGLEKLADAKKAQKGVLLLGAHYSMLDLAGTLICNHIDSSITYKRQRNPVLNYIMVNGRARHYTNMYQSKEVRDIIKALRQGEVVWYAPDQDFGFKGTIFSDFFGVPTATLTSTTALAKLGRAQVLPMTYFRRADNSGYDIEIYDPLPIPGASEAADADCANQFMEQQIRRYPSQYLWLHKRFKSQPNEEHERGKLYRKPKPH